MEPDEREDTRTYKVVVNHEEQYSIWLADHEIPAGWKPVRFEGSKAECIAYIEEVWTDMRPLSWRKNEEWGNWRDLEDSRTYKVVVNAEKQYSLWFHEHQNPRAWKDAGFKGTKKQCLDHIEEVWTDMRPLSWRKKW